MRNYRKYLSFFSNSYNNALVQVFEVINVINVAKYDSRICVMVQELFAREVLVADRRDEECRGGVR